MPSACSEHSELLCEDVSINSTLGSNPQRASSFIQLTAALLASIAFPITLALTRCQTGKARSGAVTPQPRIRSWYPFQWLSFAHCGISSKQLEKKSNLCFRPVKRIAMTVFTRHSEAVTPGPVVETREQG